MEILYQLPVSKRGGRECSVKDLINVAGNLEYFGFLPWIVSDMDLGESAVNGGSVQMLQGLPDEVLAFLDKEKVGACLRETEKGVFTKEGYCYRVKEGWQEIYNGQNLPEQETGSDAILSVRLENRKHSEHGKVWLSLPCSTEGMAYMLLFMRKAWNSAGSGRSAAQSPSWKRRSSFMMM